MVFVDGDSAHGGSGRGQRGPYVARRAATPAGSTPTARCDPRAGSGRSSWSTCAAWRGGLRGPLGAWAAGSVTTWATATRSCRRPSSASTRTAPTPTGPTPRAARKRGSVDWHRRGRGGRRARDRRGDFPAESIERRRRRLPRPCGRSVAGERAPPTCSTASYSPDQPLRRRRPAPPARTARLRPAGPAGGSKVDFAGPGAVLRGLAAGRRVLRHRDAQTHRGLLGPDGPDPHRGRVCGVLACPPARASRAAEVPGDARRRGPGRRSPSSAEATMEP